ncbi:MAG: hypothetical protein M0R33_05465 [Methylomonas sp.]|jgi:hypothetical protein|uniref:hypothetical protein n=1 Tax=Methylomonas sp. TaxID=418 RepID=UPI0025DEB974|nr:hypothetical protein [Methylomonas sp.]MCK9605883.1 hypothetical protein [Methylomonas sp.]
MELSIQDGQLWEEGNQAGVRTRRIQDGLSIAGLHRPGTCVRRRLLICDRRSGMDCRNPGARIDRSLPSMAMDTRFLASMTGIL